MWTKDALQELIRDRLSGHQFFVVANREPYLHQYVGRRIECVPPVSGMVSALDPILRASGGKWIAHGSGSADRKTADSFGRLGVPPGDPSYILRRVWLNKEQEEGYYNGVSNQGLWPLCHMAFTRPVFDPKHWPIYREVNELFAKATIEEAGDKPTFVFVQDYHYGLLPQMLKTANANLIVAQFWHIPWPAPQWFQAFPWKEELLDGLLGNDLLGFHLRSHCLNFLETVERTIEAKVDYERHEVVRKGKTTVVRAFPISIDFDAHQRDAQNDDVAAAVKRWQHELGITDELIGIGIDRIDYTKGIPERLRALDRFLERHPEYRGKLTFVQIGVPSRTHVPAYQYIDDEIDKLVDDINWRWGYEDWKPIVYKKTQFGPADMMALHRLANFCMVTSLDDGMNLVAKEFVASRTDGDGALILSQFTGAAREMGGGAMLVNPFASDEMAEAIYQVVTMSQDERRRRMQKMREAVAENNVYRWAGKFLAALTKFDFPETTRIPNLEDSTHDTPAWAA
jgi:alpha,alpha-trehalose-phosphate synthase [UDP-forming]